MGWFFFYCAEKLDGGIRSEEEEKVYSWLHTLAQTERNLVFEYVRSTERGMCCLFYGFTSLLFKICQKLCIS